MDSSSSPECSPVLLREYAVEDLSQPNTMEGDIMETGRPSASKRDRDDDSDGCPDDWTHVRKKQREHQYLNAVILSSTEQEKKLSNLNGIKISKEIHEHVTSVINVWKLRSGDLKIKCNTAEDADKLSNIKVFCDIKITCDLMHPHTVGVVRYVDGDITDEDLKKEWNKSKVTKIRRVMFKDKDSGEMKISRTVIVTFATLKLPTHLYLGYERIKVEPYVVRCFKCQIFGHVAKYCTRQKKCSSCGNDHDVSDCAKKVTEVECFRCGGSHSASSPKCPHYKSESKIQLLRSNHDMAYSEAVKIVKASSAPTQATPKAPSKQTKTATSKIVPKKNTSVLKTVQQSASKDPPVTQDANPIWHPAVLVTFMAGVIHKVAKMENPTEKEVNEVISAAAATILKIKMSPDTIKNLTEAKDINVMQDIYRRGVQNTNS